MYNSAFIMCCQSASQERRNVEVLLKRPENGRFLRRAKGRRHRQKNCAYNVRIIMEKVVDKAGMIVVFL